MPIFRKDTVADPKRLNKLRNVSKRRAEFDHYGGNSKGLTRAIITRRLVSREWEVNNTPFHEVDKYFRGALLRAVTKFKQSLPSRKMNILDWGCGSGDAAHHLARDKYTKVFGFSADGFESHLYPGEVEFLHTTKEALCRYFKKRGVKLDLIYSYYGLDHLSTREMISHISELKSVLAVGGKIIFSTSSGSLWRKDFAPLEQEGFQIEDTGRYRFIALTRIK